MARPRPRRGAIELAATPRGEARADDRERRPEAGGQLWFGRNWDAFADGLGDVRSDRDTLVLWDGSGELAAANEEQLAVALEILRDRCETMLGGASAVLVREGPEPLANDA